MDERAKKNLRTISEEFHNIKSSLGPLLNEIRTIKVLESEMRRLRAETDSKLKKVEFGVRHAAQIRPVINPKEISDLRAKVDYLSKELNRLKEEQREGQKIDDLTEKALANIDKKLPKLDSVSEIKLAKIRREMAEMDNRYRHLINSTAGKTAALIPGFDVLDRKVMRINESVKETQDRLNDNIKTINKHFDSIVEEINLHKKEMHSDKKNITKLEQRTMQLENAIEKFDKSSDQLIEELKTRISNLEAKVSSTRTVDKSQTGIQDAHSKSLAEHRTQIKEIEDRMEKDFLAFRLEIAEVNKKLNNVSKLLNDMEKVL